jgi:hypothetical protein
MKPSVCPFCDLVSAAPHRTQEACISALQEEIARTRQLLERRRDPLVVAGVRMHRSRPRHSAGFDEQAQVETAPRLSLRCAIERWI